MFFYCHDIEKNLIKKFRDIGIDWLTGFITPKLPLERFGKGVLAKQGENDRQHES